MLGTFLIKNCTVVAKTAIGNTSSLLFMHYISLVKKFSKTLPAVKFYLLIYSNKLATK